MAVKQAHRLIVITTTRPGQAEQQLDLLSSAVQQGWRLQVRVFGEGGVNKAERRIIQRHGWHGGPGTRAEAAAYMADSASPALLVPPGADLRALIPGLSMPAVPVLAPLPELPVPVVVPPTTVVALAPPVVTRPPPAPGTRLAVFLVATSNRPQLLAAVLHHLSLQTIPAGWDYEILVGGQPGDPGEAVAARSIRTTFVAVPSTKVTDKLNHLAKSTEAELLLMADDDDLQPPNRLAAAVRSLEQGAEWSGSGLHRFLDRATGAMARWDGKAISGHVGTSISITRQLFLKVGGYPSVDAGKDGHLEYRIRTKATTGRFADISGDIGEGLICLQHGNNINTRPFPAQGVKVSKGNFSIVGEGHWSAVNLPVAIQRTLQSLMGAPIPIPVAPGPALTCAKAGPGQSAFIDGLRDLGFKSITVEATAAALAKGLPVLGHGWWSGFHQFAQHKNFHTLWHSGYAGSDLMGEGATLASAMAVTRVHQGRILWLEQRDVLPERAVHMVPVWNPGRMADLAEPRPPKVPNSVLVAFHGKYPSNAKNILASVAGAAATTGQLHLSKSSFEGDRGRVVREILTGRNWVSHDFMPRKQAIQFVSSMTVMSHVSLSDTWPYLVMESIYAGTPVVLCEVVNWTRYLSEWAQERCVARPATSSEAIRSKIQHLLDHPDDRVRLVAEQRAVLDHLAPLMATRAVAILRRLGFPAVDPYEGLKPVATPLPVPAPVPVSVALPVPAPKPLPVPAPKPLPAPAAPLVPMPVSTRRVVTNTERLLASIPLVDGKRDLRSEVTVFVIASGEPSVSSCHGHLDKQDCLFQRKNIYNVSPMWRAFQQMLDRCETPYYVQVDADMLLDPWAVWGLYSLIKAREEALGSHPQSYGFTGIAQGVAWLWDADVERPIQGVKIYRHDICSRYPYEESLSCEQVQNGGLKRDGYQVLGMQLGGQDLGGGKWQRTKQTFGTHFASQTPAMAFERWQRLMQKHRKLPWMGWLSPYPERLEKRWLANPTNQIYKAQYLGCVAGLTGPIPEGERDSRKPNQDYRRVASYLGEYSKGPREVTLYLTDACNFKCVFGDTPCKRQTDQGVPHEGNLTPGFLRSFLQHYPTIKSCCIAGFGEPLLHPELPGLIQVLAEHQVFVGIISNGSLVAHKAAMLNSLPIGYLSVSLNATNAAEHRVMSQTELWDKVLEGLRVMRASKIRTGISYVVTNHNTHRIPDLLALCKSLGVQFIHLHNVLPHAGVDHPGFLKDVLTVKSTTALAGIERAKQAPGAELVEVWPELIDLDRGPPGKCMSPFVSIGIDGKGNVSGCRRVDPPEQSYGGCFGEAWNNPHFTTLLAQITGDREDHPACRGCFGNWKG